MAKVKINPNFYIGLGGTGIKAILEIKAKYLKEYGEIPPCTEFLCFDSDTKDLYDSFLETEYYIIKTDNTRVLIKENIKLAKNEIIDISLKNYLLIRKCTTK